MLRGFYISASGMMSTQTAMDTKSNNLANVKTTGFKKSQNAFKAYPEKELSRTNDQLKDAPIGTIDPRPDIGPLNMGAVSDGTYTDYSQGGMKNTGNPLDFALEGPGFFEVQLPDGTSAYTRSGDFKLNEESQLVTSRGHTVMGEDGPIEIDENLGKINAVDNGQILGNNGELQGQLRVVQFENPQKLRERGDTMYTQGENNPIIEDTEGVRVHHKQLEGSNTNPIEAMTDIVRVSRRFQMNQRSLRRQDELLQQAIRQVGRG
jgi:flagellar basal-body rod protein FlgF